jgi:hypothetical protein
MQQKITITVRVQDVETKQEVVHREILVQVDDNDDDASILSEIAAAIMKAAVKAA